MRTRVLRVGIFSLSAWLILCSAWAQEQVPAQEEEQASGEEIVIPGHWSPYQAPDQYPEGTELHIIVRGDTLWDLAGQYLENPFLWPQLWDANRYITDPHWIYPGDPLVIPELEVLRAAEEEPGVPGAPGVPGVEAPPGVPAPGVPEGPVGPSLYPATEEVTIQCAGYVTDREDESIRILGSEDGEAKFQLATGDIVYLNKGSRDGISPGHQYYTQRRMRKIGHPARRGSVGWHVYRTGWVTVLAVQEKTAIAEITQACADVHEGDYLLPFEPVPVPLVVAEPPANRMTPESGGPHGYIVASLEDVVTLGQGYFVALDMGEEDGLLPGNVLTIYRYLYPDTQRKVLGEAAVLTVRKKTSTAKIIYSYDFIDVGDEVELK
ncbi:MAG: LysM peptidoglycan-binding domain-containing protein [Acidobacteriota bacterium]